MQVDLIQGYGLFDGDEFAAEGRDANGAKFCCDAAADTGSRERLAGDRRGRRTAGGRKRDRDDRHALGPAWLLAALSEPGALVDRALRGRRVEGGGDEVGWLRRCRRLGLRRRLVRAFGLREVVRNRR